LDNAGQLVGVNAFKAPDAQGLSFAVSARDVRAFLATPVSQNQVESECRSRVLFEGRSKNNDAFIRNISLKCDDRADIIIVVPDNKMKPIMALIDVSRRNKIEGIVLDERRAGKWNTSFWDSEIGRNISSAGNSSRWGANAYQHGTTLQPPIEAAEEFPMFMKGNP
jgi:hypothetical protein